MMTNGRGDRGQDTPPLHRGIDHVAMIGDQIHANFIRASGHMRAAQQAAYMTAPKTRHLRHTHPLPTGGRPYMESLGQNFCSLA